ncbi:lipoprotein [Spiroplasma sp. Moj]|uniref:lipoprotein n=1 Tax=Spiroplasma sp. Moj TaxID=1922342 RepID=UPI0039EE82BD|nr:hypothetical protein [Spiroplasma sp. Moj]
MKRLLGILSVISLVSTGTINLISCNYKKPFNNKDENQKLKDENQKLKDENQKLKWKIDKNILFINSINSPTKINANNPNEVKEYELVFALKQKVLEAVKTIDDSLTENDFILAFKDYFNQFQPRYIDLTISKKITIIILGKNKTNGQKEFDVFLPAISKNKKWREG